MTEYKKKIVCFYYLIYKKCNKSNCLYCHDLNLLISEFNHKYDYLNKTYNNIPNDIKIMLLNAQNYYVFTKYYSYDKKNITLILLISLILIIHSSININWFNNIKRQNIIENINNDINYMLSLCILIYTTQQTNIKILKNLTNKMCRGLILSRKIKCEYANTLIKYILNNTDEKNIYTFIIDLNDKILEKTYNNKNIYMLYDYTININEYDLLNKICRDKQLILSIIQDTYCYYYNKDDYLRHDSLLNKVLQNIDIKLLNDTEYIFKLLSYGNKYITYFLNINNYIFNKEILKQILKKNMNKYNEIKNKNNSIISIGCNIDKNKVPSKDKIKLYTYYLYKILKGNLEEIYKIIAEYIIDK